MPSQPMTLCDFTRQVHDGRAGLTIWECPHEAEADQDLCLFHLPIHMRPPDSDAAEKFVSIVNENSSSTSKEFIGAKFDDFKLECDTLGADEQIDLRHTCATTIDWDIENVAPELNLNHCTVHGDADFSAITFESNMNLISSNFRGKVEFDNVICNGEVSARGLTCESEASFESVEFRERVGIQEAIFEDYATFDDIRCKKEGKFHNTDFNGGAGFRLASFISRVSFKRTDFHNRGSFSDATFSSMADFKGMSSNWLIFIDATFDGTIQFDSSSVSAEIDFRQARFKDNASFKRISWRESEFEGAIFEEAIDFTRAFINWAKFSDVTFEEKADFTNAVFRYLNMSGSIFREDVSFQTDLSTLLFPITPFQGPAKFDGVTVRGTIDVRILNDSGGVISIGLPTFASETDFSNAEITGGRLDGITFAEESSGTFTDVNLEGASLRAADCSEIEFINADLSNTTCKETVFEGTNLEGANFTQANLLGADYTNALLFRTTFADAQIADSTTFLSAGSYWTWVPGCTRGMKTVIYDPRTAPEKSDTPDRNLENTYLQAASVYTQLENLGQSNGATSFASTCFRWRKDMICSRYLFSNCDTAGFQPLRGNIARITNAVSRYGDSPYRVIASSGIVILGSTLLYKFGSSGIAEEGASTTTTSLSQLLYFSIVTFTTMGGGALQPAGEVGKWIAGIESLLGALLIALLVAVLSRRATR